MGKGNSVFLSLQVNEWCCKMVFTLEQQIFILQCYIETHSYMDTVEKFAQNYPETSGPQKSVSNGSTTNLRPWEV
jgi:hypothetical protein